MLFCFTLILLLLNYCWDCLDFIPPKRTNVDTSSVWWEQCLLILAASSFNDNSDKTKKCHKIILSVSSNTHCLSSPFVYQHENVGVTDHCLPVDLHHFVSGVDALSSVCWRLHRFTSRQKTIKNGHVKGKNMPLLEGSICFEVEECHLQILWFQWSRAVHRR